MLKKKVFLDIDVTEGEEKDVTWITSHLLGGGTYLNDKNELVRSSDKDLLEMIRTLGKKVIGIGSEDPVSEWVHQNHMKLMFVRDNPEEGSVDGRETMWDVAVDMLDDVCDVYVENSEEASDKCYQEYKERLEG